MLSGVSPPAAACWGWLRGGPASSAPRCCVRQRHGRPTRPPFGRGPLRLVHPAALGSTARGLLHNCPAPFPATQELQAYMQSFEEARGFLQQAEEQYEAAVEDVETAEQRRKAELAAVDDGNDLQLKFSDQVDTPSPSQLSHSRTRRIIPLASVVRSRRR